MKTLFTLTTLSLLAFSGSALAASPESLVKRSLQKNSIVKAAVAQGKSATRAKSCETRVDSITPNHSGLEFEAVIVCSTGGTSAEDGEGQALIHVKGAIYGEKDLAPELELSIQFAG